ncbi:MAG TPA: class I lanthipeptide [Kofleriaceae bacterium]|jgi:hypothetical protein|nr:class I lanthipeptide [Kofleriaceae bacterium]
MKKISRKNLELHRLTLRKETIVYLVEDRLKQVAGASITECAHCVTTKELPSSTCP